MRSGVTQSTLIGSVVLVAASAAALAADAPSGIDYASPAMTSPTPASGWDVWGDASLGLEFYTEPSFDYHEWNVAGSARALFRLGNGWNVGVGGYAGVDLANDVTFGNVNTDIFYATPTYAAGIYAGLFGSSDGYTNFFIGGQAARFFSTIDVGGWLGWETGNDNAEAGVWLLSYLTPNTAIGGNIFWEGNADYNRYGIGWLAEHRFTDSQWTVWTDGGFAQYVGFGADFGAWDARLGVRYLFGPPGTTLQQHNHVMPF